MAVAKVESLLLVITKKQMLMLLHSFSSVHKEMKVVANRRLLYLSRAIDSVKQEFFGSEAELDEEVLLKKNLDE